MLLFWRHLVSILEINKHMKIFSTELIEGLSMLHVYSAELEVITVNMASLHSGSWINGTCFNELFCSPLTSHTCVRVELIGAVVYFRLARISPISFTT